MRKRKTLNRMEPPLMQKPKEKEKVMSYAVPIRKRILELKDQEQTQHQDQ
jgi:hypothetical protein